MKVITLMCGLPRSGKSTWVKENKTNEVVVSADEFRFLVYNQRFWSGGEPLMWSIREMFLKMLMKQGIDIIVDETNTTKDRRAPIISLAKEYGYTIQCQVIQTNREVCMDRALENGQDNLVPIIDRMSKQFHMPIIEEGFNEVHYG